MINTIIFDFGDVFINLDKQATLIVYEIWDFRDGMKI
jgi:hypothetical protein